MKFTYKKNFAFYLIMLVVLIYSISLSNWRKQSLTIYQDIKGYYIFLPATIIYGDIELKFLKGNSELYKKMSGIPTGDGRFSIKFTMGVSYLVAPFFLVSHGICSVLAPELADGYSYPYRIGFLFSAFFYLGLGLYYLRKTLLKFFSVSVTSITMIIIVLGSNLWYYSTLTPTMSHVYSFSLISVFIFYTISWWEEVTYKKTILLGLLIGVISLIRPTNILLGLFLPLYGINKFKDVGNHLRHFFVKYYIHTLLIIFFVLLIWVPQIMYYKLMFNEWFHNSYGKESIIWLDPEYINGLFSYRKGWLIYSPLMALSIIGIIPMIRKKQPFSLAVIALFIISTYIAFAWWCWWYGGSFGQRILVDIYALLALPIASIIAVIIDKNKIVKILGIFILSFFIALNVFQSNQYKSGILHYDSMTKKAYWNLIGVTKYPKGYLEMLEKPDYEKAILGEDAIIKDHYKK